MRQNNTNQSLNWKLYDLDGKDYTEEDSLTLTIEALNEFKSENPSFIGGKYIYAPIKVTANEKIATYFETIRRLHSKFPNFLIGFDLVGQEDPSPPLVSYAEQILQLPDDIKLFFHAGETNWYGSIDENLVCISSFQFISFHFISKSFESKQSCRLGFSPPVAICTRYIPLYQ